MISHEQEAAQEFSSVDESWNYDPEQEAAQGFCIRGAFKFF